MVNAFYSRILLNMFQNVLSQAKKDYPHLKFKKSSEFFWSPKNLTVYYTSSKNHDQTIWSLLHEVSHAILKHHSFSSDFELLKMEVDAWEKAKDIAQKYNVQIDTDHIEDCLDTYRDWVHLRSKCPLCEVHAFQVDPKHYKCHNCMTIWKVSQSRFCRVHRIKTN